MKRRSFERPASTPGDTIRQMRRRMSGERPAFGNARSNIASTRNNLFRSFRG